MVLNPSLSSSEARVGERVQRGESEEVKRGGEVDKEHKIIVCALNVDGMWDDHRRLDIVKALAVEQTAGGILMLQDLRTTEAEIKAKWKD